MVVYLLLLSLAVSVVFRIYLRFLGLKLRFPVEVGFLVSFFVPYFLTGNFGESLYWGFFLSTLFAVSVVDFYTFILPPEILFPSTAIFLAVNYAFGFVPFSESLLAGAIAFFSFLFLFFFYKFVRKTEGLGLGDVVLLTFVGVAGGYEVLYASVVVGSVLALLSSLPVILKHKTLQYAFPFGPFLSFGASVGVLYHLSSLS